MRRYFILVLVLLMVNSSLAGTRQKSVEIYLEDLRKYNEGYSNSINENITLSSTTNALEISNILGIEVKNKLDILLYYQKSQDENGGFAEKPDGIISFNTTINALRGLPHLQVNNSQINNWNIFTYLNQSAVPILFENKIINNQTVAVTANLTVELMDIWYKYISYSFILGYTPLFEPNTLISKIKNFQYPNGSYVDYTTAITAVNLLSLLGANPTDADLAAKFILAFNQNDGGFSHIQNNPSNLLDTYLGIRAISQLNLLNMIEKRNDLIIFILNQQETNSGFSANGITTLQNTWYAILSLFYMDELNELLSPDVIQTAGFINFNPISLILLILIPVIRRKKI